MTDKRTGVQLGFTVVGYAVGAYFGSPQLGGMIGTAAGMAVSYAAFGPETPYSQGPQLGDQAIQSSAYGAPIAYVYGAYRIAGNLIWTSGLIERLEVEGGKGGPQPETGTFQYKTNLAFALCQGPIEEVLRIWADGNLIHDKTGASAQVTHDGIYFRFYGGSEDQLPDPVIESFEGAGNVPGYRGTCYVVFYDLELEKFGNRIPNFTFELLNTPERVRTRTPFLHSAAGLHRDLSSIDFQRRRFFFAYSDDADAMVYCCNLDTLRETRKKRVDAMFDDQKEPPSYTFINALYTSEVTGDLYMSIGSGNSAPLFRFSGNGLDELARFGEEGGSTQNSLDNIVSTQWMTGIECGLVSQTYDSPYELLVTAPTELLVQVMLGPFGMLSMFDSGEVYPFGYILCAGWTGDLSLYHHTTLRFVWCDEMDEAFTMDTTVRGVCKGGKGEGWGDAWVVGTEFYTPYDSVHIYRIKVWAGAAFFPDSLDGETGATVGVEAEKTDIIAAADLHAATTGLHQVSSVWFDKADSSIVVAVQLLGVSSDQKLCVFKYRQGDGVVWKTHLGCTLDPFGDHNIWQARLVNNDLAFIGEEGGGYCAVYKISLATGALLYRDPWPLQGLELYGPQWHDSLHAAIYYYDHPTVKWARIYLDRYAAGGTTLGKIVADLCERSGLLPTDYDVTQLGDAVRGYLVARPTTARAPIEQLALAYFFDGVESDGKLVFRKRGMAPNFAIAEDDLLVSNHDSAALSERRTQEVELPERVTIRFTDFARDYNASTQMIRRITHPVPTMHTKNQLVFELPIATVADEAKRWAHAHLHAAYNERSQFEFSLPARFLGLEPTDVITLSLNDGTVLTVRVTAVDIGVDFTLKVTAVSQEMALYQSAITGDTGLGGVSDAIAVVGGTLALFPDLPLLRDGDAAGDTVHRQYFWAGGYADGWPGAIVYRSADGVGFSYLAKVPKSQAIRYGLAETALPPPASPWATDTDNALDVVMLRGAEYLASISDDELLGGGNAALLFNPDTSLGEVIQFRDVEALGDDRYRLRTLLRGRRGTDIFCGLHRSGEYLILLDATAQMVSLPLTDRGALRQFKVATPGQALESVVPKPRRFRGFDLMPYAPVHLTAVAAGSPQDITLSWIRRTRIGGEWMSGLSEVPLSEATEAYEVDILTSASDATVKRTLTAAAPAPGSSPGVVYPNAQIVADFGAVPASLSVAVYQMSAVVGRGFPRVATLTVN
ncbi:MAG: phage tail protein [Rhodospirillales bacterium]